MSVKPMQIFKCKKGVVIETLNCSDECVELTCCGEPMELMEAKTEDAGKEKHVPVVSVEDGVLKVKVGSVPHPMEEEHYIMWIEVIKDGCVVRKHLKPGQKPEADFCKMSEEGLLVREYCSVHGLWKTGSCCCGCS